MVLNLAYARLKDVVVPVALCYGRNKNLTYL